MYTLISSVGTGMYSKSKNEGTGYRETTYVFNERKRISSRLFPFAVLRSGMYEINEVILVGTKTSSWDAFIVQDMDADEDLFGDLWLSLVDECEHSNTVSPGGISLDNVKELERVLTQTHGVRFTVIVHEPRIDDDTLDDIIGIYQTIPEHVSKGNKILFDITHGFRSMPLFIYQSMADAVDNEIELVYGEYIRDLQESHVRNLSLFHTLGEIHKSTDLFLKTFNGYTLSEYLKPYWGSGARWVAGFSNLVQSAHILMIRTSVSQLKNALKNDLDSTASPNWVLRFRVACVKIYRRFESCVELSDFILVLAELLIDRKMITQAILALQIALEVKFTEKLKSYEHIGDYDFYTRHGSVKDSIYHFVKHHNLSILRSLGNARNMIAHGGGKESVLLDPNGRNLPTQKEALEYLIEVKRVFPMLERGE